MTSDSDTRPEPRDANQALDELLGDIRQVQPILTGDPVIVSLKMRISEVLTPQAAVDTFMATLTRLGSDAFTFAVTDEEGDDEEVYLIRQGAFVPLEVDPIPEYDDDADDDDVPE